ncbi:MAG: hypothetical protein AB7P18_22120 [Candidatus Binatia bacterium]
MISDFERALANVLGSRLPSPFGGAVEVAPGNPGGPMPKVIVGVLRTEIVSPEFLATRPEVVPGATAPRRVLRLRCQVGMEVRPRPGSGRSQQMLGVDALLYLLDAPELRNGTAITGDPDPGFLIQQLQIVDSQSPLDPTREDVPAVGVQAQVEGWFWPIGVPGQTGQPIGEVRVRETILPFEVAPLTPELRAGGEAVDLTFRIGTIGLLRLHVGANPLPRLPFGALAFVLFGPGGTPGAGTLSGGVAGNGGVQLVTLSPAGEAVIRYTPPAEAVTDELRVALDNGAGGLGVEVGRLTLRVRSA